MMLPFLLPPIAATPPPTVAPRPHLIFALADDLGHSNVGWNTDGEVLTPHLDALRADGVALEQHYVYKFCSPSRSSFLSGRLPVHVNQENSATEQRYAGIPLGMTVFVERLAAEAGYVTAHVGKWHAGQASMKHVPHGRGFQHALSFFNFGEDHYTQRRFGNAANGSPPGHSCKGVDLWRDTSPAHGLNGTYGGFTFGSYVVDTIMNHDASRPLFMFVAWQNNHPPLEVPDAYVARYPAGPRRTTINGMSAFLDDSMRNLTAALHAKGMWETALLVFSGDNGGYLGYGGDDAPLRGGKFSDFEGGVRVPSFAVGGLLPMAVRGKALRGPSAYIHIADWAPTFLALAGVASPFADARAAKAGLPPIDGLDVWPLLSGANLTSPRTDVPLSVLPSSLPAARHGVALNSGAAAAAGRQYRDPNYYVGGEGLIHGRYKLVRGFQHRGPASKTSNASCAAQQPKSAAGWQAGDEGVQCTCGEVGCLFDLVADPHETKDVAAAQPQLMKELRARLEAVRATVYAPDRGPLEQAACDVIDDRYGGFWGPWL